MPLLSCVIPCANWYPMCSRTVLAKAWASLLRAYPPAWQCQLSLLGQSYDVSYSLTQVLAKVWVCLLRAYQHGNVKSQIEAKIKLNHALIDAGPGQGVGMPATSLPAQQCQISHPGQDQVKSCSVVHRGALTQVLAKAWACLLQAHQHGNVKPHC